MLLIDHLIAAVACAILLIGHDNAVAVWVGTIIFGFGIASMFPSMLALSEQSIPSTGTVTSIYLVGSSVGTMVLPGTMGALIEHFGAVALPVECAIGVVITGGIVVAFRARVGGDRKSPNASVNR